MSFNKWNRLSLQTNVVLAVQQLNSRPAIRDTDLDEQLRTWKTSSVLFTDVI